MNAFTSILPMLMQGMGGAGSLMGMINQFSLASKEKAAMDQSIYYSKHPEAINALVKKFQQPLSAGLTSGVGNIVNASMAEQGLSQAPGIQSQVMAQALAPYQQNAQQMAIAQAMQAIGLPIDALKSIQSVKGGTDLASMLKGVLPGGGSGGGSGNWWDNVSFPGDTGYPSTPGITLDTAPTPPMSSGDGGVNA